jgi:hypothetical protein
MARKYWKGTPPLKCDICEEPIAKLFFDAKTTQGPWGTLCEECFERHTYGELGLGFGQRYEKQANGKWLKTGG